MTLLFSLRMCFEFTSIYRFIDLTLYGRPAAIACTVIIMIAYALLQIIMSGWWIMQANEVRKFLRYKVKMSDVRGCYFATNC